MKVLRSLFCLTLTLVTLSSMHTAEGVNCYQCKYNTSKLSELTLRQGQDDARLTKLKQAKTCPTDGGALDESYHERCEIANPGEKQMCAVLTRTFRDPKTNRVQINNTLLGCVTRELSHIPGTCFDWAGHNVCPCEGDLCNDGKIPSADNTVVHCHCHCNFTQSGSGSIHPGLFSLSAAASLVMLALPVEIFSNFNQLTWGHHIP